MIPTSTRVTVEVKTAVPSAADAVAVFVTDGGQICGDAPHLLDAAMLRALRRLIDVKVARGKAREVVFDLIDLPTPRGKRPRVLRLFAAGVGKPGKLDPEAVRQAAGAVARAVRRHRVWRVAMVPPVLKTPGFSGAEASVSGFLLASFDYDEYRGSASRKQQNGEDEQSDRRAVALTVLATAASAKKQVGPAVQRATIIAEAQNYARTIAFRPGNDINPPALARVAQDLARQVGLRCRVLDERQMRKLGMGGILAVGAGSSITPPRLIILEHRPLTRSGSDGGSRPLLVVGKAITFDTGGISIKPAEKMGRMVFDKCGGMAVLGLMCAVARLKLPVHVVGILSSAENHISDTAYRPGDILRMYNGVTVEVTNTDAEGRLVLGDALAWGIETYKPAAVIDLATLTGGVVVALGKTMAGVFSNSDALVKELNEISELTGEKMWRLPLGPEQREQLKSDVADIVNSAGREGHPLQGGAFLSHFVPEDNSVPWAHLDIAGVADTDKELPYYRKGATGWGVRTLVEWVARRAARGR
ncbi:leucyl aminopeptidase [Fontivita pretiosa]|uniref:leucyl aminopeptidase n=1 Tax=Fontivita pretiosa TaxID=2989684 RepID=UPI003D1698CC